MPNWELAEILVSRYCPFIRLSKQLASIHKARNKCMTIERSGPQTRLALTETTDPTAAQ